MKKKLYLFISFTDENMFSAKTKTSYSESNSIVMYAKRIDRVTFIWDIIKYINIHISNRIYVYICQITFFLPLLGPLLHHFDLGVDTHIFTIWIEIFFGMKLRYREKGEIQEVIRSDILCISNCHLIPFVTEKYIFIALNRPIFIFYSRTSESMIEIYV